MTTTATIIIVVICYLLPTSLALECEMGVGCYILQTPLDNDKYPSPHMRLRARVGLLVVVND
jgi:hypothetical protein